MKDMINSEDVYVLFQKAKCRNYGKPYFAHKMYPPKEPDKWSIKKGYKRLDALALKQA